MRGHTQYVQEDARREERAAAERMIAAQAEAARAKQRVAQMAAQTGASAELPPITDAEAQVLLTLRWICGAYTYASRAVDSARCQF